MGMVNSFQGFGGNPGYSNFFTPQIATPKPAFDPTLPSGDCLQRVTNANQTQTILGTMGKWVANPAATA